MQLPLPSAEGSHVGVEVRAWVSQRTPWDPGSGFQSLPGNALKKNNMYGTFPIGVGGRVVTLV